MFEIDPWEEQYILNLQDRELVSWTDKEAWHRLPKLAHLYDKKILSDITGIVTYDLETEIPDPSGYPYIIKPKTNFDGLSKDCYIASSPEEIEDIHNMIAQEIIRGQQFTSDVVIKNGFIMDFYTFSTHKNAYNEIIMFESNPFLNNHVRGKLQQMFKDFTGVINCEYIEDRIIEIHLRPSLQFYDICGGLIQQIPNFLKTKEWQKVNYQKSYSKVYRTRFDGYVDEIEPLEALDSLIKPPTITSIQKCWLDGYKLSQTDPSVSIRNRVLVVNGYNLEDILRYGKNLRGKIALRNT